MSINADVEHWAVNKSALHHAGGVVAAQHHLAAKAGGDVLARGGNAVDAAIGAALALGVVEPWMCGLGGSGAMTIWLQAEGRAVTLDFQGVLAAATRTEDYPPNPDAPITLMGFPTVRDNANVEGYRSITVPGAAAGFDHAVTRYGTMSLADIAAPAVVMARTGIASDWFTCLQSSLMMAVLRHDDVSSKIYLPDGAPILPEGRLFIPGLADTLQAYADGGADAFYRGDLAARIVADLQAGGSTITGEDLAAYTVTEEAARSAEHRGAVVHTPGVTSGGERMRDALAYIAEHMPLNGSGPSHVDAPETWTTYADALDAAWRKHNIRIGRVTEQGSCTSNLSAVDRDGNMVALTHTLLNRFGSGVTLPKTGLLMNNAVSYFDPRPSFPTTMEGGKRINASNICPMVASRDGKGLFALGASGGNHIMPAVTQVAAQMLDFGSTLEEAMNHARIDASDRGSTRVDPALGAKVVEKLQERGPVELAQRLTFPKLYACVSGVARDDDGGWCGLNDPSQPVGGSAGPERLEWDEDATTATASVRA
ncbi:gamma-glutamyltransferase [Ahrensia sp. R2A130]|uniref:gamma-glutamyltransferase n=1 Tax=Ahrensia sp. R2A130 TaxID=744979 RepID=UPI0001E094C5|nr:gamma-glutamyltransferase [Ahrensia sp. R2A130]EFL88172.1 gamma-glutamyltranspeptidase [Ahrensia sp. R2A130]